MKLSLLCESEANDIFHRGRPACLFLEHFQSIFPYIQNSH